VFTVGHEWGFGSWKTLLFEAILGRFAEAMGVFGAEGKSENGWPDQYMNSQYVSSRKDVRLTGVRSSHRRRHFSVEGFLTDR